MFPLWDVDSPDYRRWSEQLLLSTLPTRAAKKQQETSLEEGNPVETLCASTASVVVGRRVCAGGSKLAALSEALLHLLNRSTQRFDAL